jgi:hypothetical protein
VIGEDPVWVELLQDVSLSARADRSHGVIPAGTCGWASLLYPKSDLTLFTAADREARAVVPLACLRRLDGGPLLEEGVQ